MPNLKYVLNIGLLVGVHNSIQNSLHVSPFPPLLPWLPNSSTPSKLQRLFQKFRHLHLLIHQVDRWKCIRCVSKISAKMGKPSSSYRGPRSVQGVLPRTQVRCNETRPTPRLISRESRPAGPGEGRAGICLFPRRSTAM